MYSKDTTKILTNDAGLKVDNDQASLTTGEKLGYTVFKDSYLFDKLAEFNRERIPERVVHAKGSGAHGYFEVTNDLSQYTKAKFLNQVGKRTEVLARFSTVGGEKGSADSARDPRGFALKFYTEDGNYDLVGNNTPIFFIRDAIKFPDFIHTQKRNPETNLKDPNAFWDFLSLTPESLHQVMRLFDDKGTPKDFRHMDGFGSHTFMWYNEAGEPFWIKYHFLTDQGIENFTDTEAKEMAAQDPDHSVRDLHDAIERGDFPSWSVYVQIMPYEEAATYKVNPFDVTKTWYEEDYPLIPLGKLVLNRNPENFFAEIEQAAFTPSNFVPGIGASPDKLLQGRLLAYPDAHRYRLGVNNKQIPVNRPKQAEKYSNHRDGFMRVDGNEGSSPNYYPTTLANVDVTPENTPPILPVEGTLARHTIYPSDIDFVQPGEYFRNLTTEQKAHFIYNVYVHIKDANQNLQYRQVALFYKADKLLGTQLAKWLGLDLDRISELASMNQQDRVNATLK